MIGVVLKGHDYKYEVSELIKLFTSDFRFIDVRDCMMVIVFSIMETDFSQKLFIVKTIKKYLAMLITEI